MNKHCIKIDLQNDLELPRIPDLTQMTDWVSASLQQDFEQLEQTIRIVDQAESHQLNKAFRHIDKPTNVLSFPADDSDYLEYDHLGDLVICASVVEAEAVQQKKILLRTGRIWWCMACCIYRAMIISPIRTQRRWNHSRLKSWPGWVTLIHTDVDVLYQ